MIFQKKSVIHAFLAFLLAIGFLPVSSLQAEPVEIDPITKSTEGMTRQSSYPTSYLKEGSGEILESVMLEVPLNEEMLYAVFLESGLGSNSISFDRGEIFWNRSGMVVYFEKRGKKALLKANNYKFQHPDHEQLIENAFSDSVLHAFEIVEEKTNDVGQTVILIDATESLLKDNLQLGERLPDDFERSYKFEKDYSYIERLTPSENTLSITVHQAYKSENADSKSAWMLDRVTMIPDSFSLTVSHGFMKLPEDDYEPLKYEPFSGFFYTEFLDYSKPLEANNKIKYADRWHLPEGETVTYYVDPYAPEDIQEIILEGGNYWKKLFTELGMPNAFEIKVLPDDKDPMSLENNMIFWVHRDTRGWSYARWIPDPRTGRILYSRVVLDSQRIRQDMMIAEGMMSPWKDSNTELVEEIKELTRERLIQLVAHEIGHTLGLRHNFVASTQQGTSVMDYPHMKFEEQNGEIRSSVPYDNEVGEWDLYAIESAYKKNKFELNPDIKYITDRDTNYGVHAKASRWDVIHGSTIEGLDRSLALRELALENFSEAVVPPDSPAPEIEFRFLPVYAFHQYEVSAVIRMIGGLNYEYTLRDNATWQTVSAEDQQSALEKVLACLEPDLLRIPDHILDILVPQYEGYSRPSREDAQRDLGNKAFFGRAGTAFDPSAVVESLADAILSELLNTGRLVRLYNQLRFNEVEFGSQDVFDGLILTLVKKYNQYADDEEAQAITEIVLSLYVNKLIDLCQDNSLPAGLQAEAYHTLLKLKTELIFIYGNDVEKSMIQYLIFRIDEYEKDPDSFDNFKPAPLPIGPPFGSCALCR